MIMKWLAAM